MWLYQRASKSFDGAMVTTDFLINLLKPSLSMQYIDLRSGKLTCDARTYSGWLIGFIPYKNYSPQHEVLVC